MTLLRRRGATVAAASFAAVAALALASCSSSADTDTDTDTGDSGSGECSEPVEITWLGTIKSEIQDQFTAAIDDYNEVNTDCVHVTIIEAPQDQPFLQTITPMYEAGEAPTVMYTLQEIPDMADKVMDWTGQPLADLAAEGTLDAGNVDGKQAGIPSTAEAFGLLYNKAVLDEAGVDPAEIKTRSDLADAFAAVDASGVTPIHFSGLWWSLGAHFTNIYHTNSADTVEGRDAILDELKAGSYDLAGDEEFTAWLDTFDLLKANSIDTATIADTDYDAGVENLASGNVGFWFMGNWAEPNLLTTTPDGEFGVMPLPINDTEGAYGNDSISVGVPGYMMIDEEQSTPEQREGAIALMTWFLTTPEGQAYWSGPVEEGGMNFIPVYDGFEVTPATYMAAEIAEYIAAGKTLEWVNSKYLAGLQECYGAAAQKYYDAVSDRAALADEMAACWQG